MELESLANDPSILMSGTSDDPGDIQDLTLDPGSFSKTNESDSESDSDEELDPSQRQFSQSSHATEEQQAEGSDGEESEPEDVHDGRQRPGPRQQPIVSTTNPNQSLQNRPQSSISSNRYRTPMGGSIALSPPPGPSGRAPLYSTQSAEAVRQQAQQSLQRSGVFVPQLSAQHTFGVSSVVPGTIPITAVPNVQPMPAYETPSAFPGPSPPLSSSMIPSASGASASGGSSFTNVVHPYPESMYPGHPAYQATSHHSNSPGQVAGSGHGAVGMSGSSLRSPLERAVENVQAHLTALQERMDILEGRPIGGSPYASLSGLGGRRISPSGSPRSSYFGAGGRGRGYEKSIWAWLTEFDEENFSWEHMGLWSTVLSPLARLTKFLGRILAFLLSRRDVEGTRHRTLSPGMAILRRLLLDASFVLLVMYVARRAWRRSGVRRREVIYAMKGVWRAIVGEVSDVSRQLVEKGV